MEKVRIPLVKKVLVNSWFLQLLLSHMFATYLTWPIYLLVGIRVFGENPFGLVHFLLAPIYVPVQMLYVAVSFLLRLPFFDIMPPLSSSIALWVSYMVFMPSCVALTFIWFARAKRRLKIVESADTSMSTSERALAEKRFKRRVRVCILLAMLAIVAIWLVRRSTLFVSAPDIKLAYLPAGEFVMGAPEEDDPSGVFGERPMHEVKISRGFYIGVTEVTQAQWKAVMRSNPSKFRGDEFPVDNVSWDDTVRFCERLSRLTGKFYRLPTEAEWEYACRAGTQTRFYFGDDPNLLGQYAWWLGNSEGKTHPVGQKKPNAFGLYDMHGNVEEWCSDLFDEEYYKQSPIIDPENTDSGIFRVLRGGSWWDLDGSIGLSCRSAAREATYQYMQINTIGFRVVMEKE
jgi:formylglycine-generating enzyme required for sulfatase activity